MIDTRKLNNKSQNQSMLDGLSSLPVHDIIDEDKASLRMSALNEDDGGKKLTKMAKSQIDLHGKKPQPIIDWAYTPLCINMLQDNVEFNSE